MTTKKKCGILSNITQCKKTLDYVSTKIPVIGILTVPVSKIKKKT